jgi:hypothetical protein
VTARAAALPASAAWQHREARSGFEAVFFGDEPGGAGCRAEGCTAAVEDGESWIVRYLIDVDETWATRRAEVVSRSSAGSCLRLVARERSGRWLVDGEAAPHLDGCLDVDLESSALTNAFPARRLGLRVGESADAPAAYVRAPGLTVERLEQRYVRLPDGDGGVQRFGYEAPEFGFACELGYDEWGLVLEYPGIAVRVS